MTRLRKALALILMVGLAACASSPAYKGHLSRGEVQDLMARSLVQKFDVSRLGGAVIVLDNGDIFSVDLPTTEAIREYVARQQELGKPATFEIE